MKFKIVILLFLKDLSQLVSYVQNTGKENISLKFEKEVRKYFLNKNLFFYSSNYLFIVFFIFSKVLLSKLCDKEIELQSFKEDYYKLVTSAQITVQENEALKLEKEVCQKKN